ncbi:MAG: hypothetical protein ACLQVY_06165 [Limisphaerales bacterium]
MMKPIANVKHGRYHTALMVIRQMDGNLAHLSELAAKAARIAWSSFDARTGLYLALLRGTGRPLPAPDPDLEEMACVTP